MIIYGDYHTHTQYSHGKGTILDNATVAAKKGLKQIAITDHGFGHGSFGVKRRDIEQVKEDIFLAKEVTGVDILLGVEANILSLDGTIDVREEDYDFLDIIIMGHHKFVNAKTVRDSILFFYGNVLANHFPASQARINRNTTAFLKSLDKYPIDAITHIGEGVPVDKMAIAKLAKQKGTYIELNAKHMTIGDETLGEMAAEGIKFIINSDEHHPDNVGEVNNALNSCLRVGVPASQIVNLDKFPKFQRLRRKD